MILNLISLSTGAFMLGVLSVSISLSYAQYEKVKRLDAEKELIALQDSVEQAQENNRLLKSTIDEQQQTLDRLFEQVQAQADLVQAARDEIIAFNKEAEKRIQEINQLRLKVLSDAIKNPYAAEQVD